MKYQAGFGEWNTYGKRFKNEEVVFESTSREEVEKYIIDNRIYLLGNGNILFIKKEK